MSQHRLRCKQRLDDGLHAERGQSCAGGRALQGLCARNHRYWEAELWLGGPTDGAQRQGVHPRHGAEMFSAITACARCSCGGWRWGDGFGASQIDESHGEGCAERFGLPTNVSGLAFESLVWEAAAGTGEIDLIKMDADGPEGLWLKALKVMLHGDRPLRVRTIIVEASFVNPETMHHFQNVLGYTVLRLDRHDARRYVTREGFDAYSAPGSIEPLDRLQKQHEPIDRLKCKYSPPGPHRPLADNVSRTKLEDEWFAVRAMRHVFHTSTRTPRFKAGRPSCSLCFAAATRCSTS